MDWQITPYTLSLALTTVLALITAAQAWTHRRRPGGIELTLTLLAVAEWSASYILEASAVTLPLKLLWSKVAYVGTLSCVPLWFHFCVAFTEPGHRIRPLAIAALWAIPIGIMGLALTNEMHHLIWSHLEFADPSHHILVYGHGPAWWVLLAYANVTLTAATILLIRAAWHLRHIYRLQSLTILASVLPPWLINVLYAFDPNAVGLRDWTPVGFGIAGALLTISFIKLQLLDLIPVAHEQVLASMQDPVFIVDDLGQIIDVNPAAASLIGIPNPIGYDSLSILATLTDQLLDVHGNPLTQVRSWEDVPPQGEITIPGKGTFEWHITLLEGPPAQVPGYLILLHDITARVAAERALEKLNQTLESQVAARTDALRTEQQRISAILDSVSDGILMIDRNQIVRYINPAFSAMIGRDPDAILGKQASLIGGEALRKLLDEGSANSERWSQEIQLIRADGQPLDVAVTVASMLAPNGDVNGFVCTIRDITHEKDLERTRKGLIDNISHQLRTPLTHMQLYAYLMAQSELDDENRKRLQVIRGQIDVMVHLMEDILEIASLEDRETEFLHMPIDLEVLLDHLRIRFEHAAQQKGINLSVEPIPPHLPTILGDQPRLIRALAEIIENAVHFTPPGGEVTMRIALTESDGRRWVTLSVQDTGPGIPPDELPHIFERFFRGRITETDQTPATGLGLSIAQGIIRAHGGHITVESSPQGTTFTVWLPISEEEPVVSSQDPQ